MTGCPGPIRFRSRTPADDASCWWLRRNLPKDPATGLTPQAYLRVVLDGLRAPGEALHRTR